MADSHRRLIRRPPETSDEDWSRLGQALGEAVQQQTALANQSPHVLGFIGQLEEVEQGCLAVHHEPASPMPLGGLFNPQAPAVNASQLVRLAAALFDALKSAHTCQDPRPASHGGLCPGVILFAQDGTAKVTDFGFAPAICSVLGADSYLNLAVGPPGEESADPLVTAAWEVLSPDEFERDDRICAFIDPEKYGTRVLNAFESGSDVIAAGFILHLLAEHQHPYLHADPDAHRLVAMSEYMAMGRYNQARRQDLRESSDPGVRVWCDLIAKTLARLPQARPTAAEVVEALQPHVKTEDAGDNLRRQLEGLHELVQRQAWDELATAARSIAASSGAPPDVVERANGLIAQAEGHALVSQARETLDGDDWPSAQEPLDTLVAMPGLPAELARQGRQLVDSVQRSLAAQQVADDVAARVAQSGTTDPVATAELMRELAARLEPLRSDEAVLPSVHHRVTTVCQAVTDRLAEVAQAERAAIEADESRASEWIGQLESALAAEEWDTLEQALSSRPDLRRWPDQVASRADAIQRQLEDHQAEQKHLAAAQADRESAEQWLAQLRQAVDTDAWGSAEQVLAEKPRLTHWPQTVLDEANQLAAQVRAASRRQADEERARQWCGDLKQAVDAGNWDRGADLLAQRPMLDPWPPDLLAEIAPYQQQAEEHVEARELERRRAEQDTRQANAWFDKANQAGKKEQWVEALDTLATPPPTAEVPEQLLQHAEKLQRFCRARLGEEIVRQLQARSQTVGELARSLVHELIAQEFEGLLHPDSVEVVVDADEFVSDHADGDGRGLLGVRLRGARAPSSPPQHRHAFDFRINEDPHTILDDAGALRAALRDELQALLGQCQKAALGHLQDTLREGLFPQANIDAAHTDPKPALSAEVALLGPDSADAILNTDLSWDARELTWTYAEPVEVVERALRVALDQIATDLRRKLIEAHAELRKYASVWSLDWVGPPPADPRVLPDRLELEAALVIAPGGPVEPQTLQTLPVACQRLGGVEFDTNASPAVAELMRIVAHAQDSDRAAIESELRTAAKTASAKVKLTVLPKKIDQPTDQLQLTLAPKGQPPVEATAEWEVSKFGYSLPAQWQQEVARILGSRPAPERPRPALSQAAPEPVRPLGGNRRRAMGLAATAAAVVVAAGLWQLWPSGTPAVSPPQNSNSTGGPNGPSQPATTPGVTNDNTSVPKSAGGPKVHPVSDNTNTAAATGNENAGTANTGHQQRVDWYNELDTDFQALVTQLGTPTHDAILELIQNGSVDDLADDFGDLADELTDADGDLRDKVRRHEAQLADWREGLSTYSGIADLSGSDIARQIELLATAETAWRTLHVTGLLKKLRPIQATYALAEQQRDKGNWRAALFFLRQADEAAKTAEIDEPIRRKTHDGVLDPLEDSRRNEIASILDQVDRWLVQNPRPAEDPLDHLAEVDKASDARNRLDQLDLDYPSGAGPGEWADMAAAQKVFPWTILNDQQKQSIEDLLAWVTLTLPVQSADGKNTSTIDFVFIRKAENAAYGVPDPIWISQTEITVDQYKAVMGDLPPPSAPLESHKEMRSQGRHPVAFVQGGQVHAVCTAIMEQFGPRLIARAPTEKEWRYALKAGSPTPDAADLLDANPALSQYDSQGAATFDPTRANLLSLESDEFLKAQHTDGFGRYAPVRSYAPNRWLLYDMIGNVGEWVAAAAGARATSFGGSFLNRWERLTDVKLTGRRRQQRLAYDEVGLRLSILPRSD